MMTSTVLVMSIIMLEERRSDREKEMEEGWREKEIVGYVKRTGTVMVLLIVVC